MMWHVKCLSSPQVRPGMMSSWPLPPSDLSCCQPCTPVLWATAGDVQQGSCWLTAPQVTLDVQREGAVSTSSAQNRPVSVSSYYNNSQSVQRGSYLSQHPPRTADLQPNVESVADLEVASPVINRAQFCPNFCIWKGHTDICAHAVRQLWEGTGKRYFTRERKLGY